MTKPILNEARVERNLAEPSIESNVKCELGEELLKELRSNTYSGRVEEDVVGHIAKVLEILDLMKIAGVNPFQHRMKTFPLSLFGDARKWWMNEGDGKNQHLGRIGRDPLEFITWMNSKFKDHKKVDETTKRALLHSWIEVGNNEGIMDEIVSSDDDRDHTNSSMITKPEIKIGDEFLKYCMTTPSMDGKDIYELIERDYSPILIPVHRDVSNPDELCKTEEFTVVRYSMGSCEEFITVGPCCKEIDDMFTLRHDSKENPIWRIPYDAAARRYWSSTTFSLMPAEDEAPTPLLPPSFLSPRIRPLSPRALAAEMRDVASSLHHSLHPSGTPSLLPIPLPAPPATAELSEDSLRG
ncbi:hypothetical protein Tco_0726189 [Tanacetum coccineum]|uniref:Retrotransposon gag domain-containing protein n=1 Tax=Tanacetum coccineum TaxID=301880 RepID=A0ABQ4YH76_9ASTR